MDTEEPSLETKCEDMMKVVVATRKKFGEMCFDYEQKTSLMENKILKLKIENFSNIKFKPKHAAPKVKDEDSREIEKITVDLAEMSQRAENLKKKLKKAQVIVSQLKTDSVGKRLREPIKTDVILVKAEKSE